MRVLIAPNQIPVRWSVCWVSSRLPLFEEKELQAHLKSGALSTLHVAFSREAGTLIELEYVLAHAYDLVAWCCSSLSLHHPALWWWFFMQNIGSFFAQHEISSMILHANANLHSFFEIPMVFRAWGGLLLINPSITCKLNLFLRSEGLCAGQDLGASKLGSIGSTCDVWLRSSSWRIWSNMYTQAINSLLSSFILRQQQCCHCYILLLQIPCHHQPFAYSRFRSPEE